MIHKLVKTDLEVGSSNSGTCSLYILKVVTYEYLFNVYVYIINSILDFDYLVSITTLCLLPPHFL